MISQFDTDNILRVMSEGQVVGGGGKIYEDGVYTNNQSSGATVHPDGNTSFKLVAKLPNAGSPGQFYSPSMVLDLASDKDTETIFLEMRDGKLFRLENFDYGAMPYKPGDWQEDGE